MINWKKPEFAEAAGLGLFTLVDLESCRQQLFKPSAARWIQLASSLAMEINLA